MTMTNRSADIQTDTDPRWLDSVREDLEANLVECEEKLRQAPAPDDISMAAFRRNEKTRSEILDALTRIVRGTFGTCEMCLEPISHQRLAAIPQARYCMMCAGRTAI